jgi:hypothetical protein
MTRGFLSEGKRCFPTNCPECGEKVWFYQDENDGRVFFDKLGGDWPKHRCTAWEYDPDGSFKKGALGLPPSKKKPSKPRIIKKNSKAASKLRAARDARRTKNASKRRKNKKPKAY